jgi:hypothetical protein
MKILAIFLLCTSLAAQQASAPAPASSNDAQTNHPSNDAQTNQKKARVFLDQMLQALGGQNYLTLQDSQLEGRTGRFYHGTSEGGSQYWRYWQWPDKERLEFTKKRDVVQLTVGDNLYELTYRGTRMIDPQKEQDARLYLERRHYSLEVVLREWLNDPGTALFDEGQALTENHSTEQLSIINSKNDSVTIFIDTDTHLPVKKTFILRDPTTRDRDEVAEVYDNYKMVQGINTPYNTMVTKNGELFRQYFVTTISYNNHLRPSLFDPGLVKFDVKKK